MGHRYGMLLTKDARSRETLQRKYNARHGKSMVWTMVALSASDQLRQRMAWALSQIYVVSDEAINRPQENEVANDFLAFPAHLKK